MAKQTRGDPPKKQPESEFEAELMRQGAEIAKWPEPSDDLFAPPEHAVKLGPQSPIFPFFSPNVQRVLMARLEEHLELKGSGKTVQSREQWERKFVEVYLYPPAQVERWLNAKLRQRSWSGSPVTDPDPASQGEKRWREYERQLIEHHSKDYMGDLHQEPEEAEVKPDFGEQGKYADAYIAYILEAFNRGQSRPSPQPAEIVNASGGQIKLGLLEKFMRDPVWCALTLQKLDDKRKQAKPAKETNDKRQLWERAIAAMTILKDNAEKRDQDAEKRRTERQERPKGKRVSDLRSGADPETGMPRGEGRYRGDYDEQGYDSGGGYSDPEDDADPNDPWREV